MLSTLTYIEIANQVFFFNDTATTEIYTLSLHDALPICDDFAQRNVSSELQDPHSFLMLYKALIHLRTSSDVLKYGKFEDRKSTRLNSSHANISYAVFCLKKKI